MSAHEKSVRGFASWDADKHRLVPDDTMVFNAAVRSKLKPEAGERFVYTVMREEDAITAGQRAYYFGRILGPFVEYTGDPDWHDQLKAKFMPDDGRTSITQLSKDEMTAYTQRCEQFCYERCPEAFALYDRVSI